MGAVNGRPAPGFTLVEVAIAIAVIAIVAAAIAVPVSAARASHEAQVTRARIAEIRAALIGYVHGHGRLPCPADATAPAGHPAAGVAAPIVGVDCAGGYAGVVPWVTLGTPETDAWGHRFAYRVARELADALDDCAGGGGQSSSICLAAEAPSVAPANADALEVRIRVRTDAVVPRAAATEPIATGLAAVVVSSGANGTLAPARSGGRRSPPSTLGADERRNASIDAVSFMTGNRRPGRAVCDDDDPARPACEFDDVLDWLSRAEVVRAVAHGGRLR